jgi:hypothetical protein
MFRRLFLIAALGALSACAVMPTEMALAPNSTLIVTRHGDRDGDLLSDKGRARAAALVAAVAEFDVQHIYSPGIERNLDTAQPLSEALKLPIKRIPQEQPTPALVERGAGTTVIWIGNKGNIATIWETLNLSDPKPIEYGDLHIIRSDANGAVTIERRTYGPE